MSVLFDPLRFTKRVVTAREMYRLVAEAAYFRAESRDFAPGHEVEDWLAAEREVAERVVLAAVSSGTGSDHPAAIRY
jgi:hypothetical protein